MRVTNGTGGGTGGVSSPIIMDVVPSHTHSGTTVVTNISHVHSVNGTTGGQNANHGHSGATDAQGLHQHTLATAPSENASPRYPWGENDATAGQEKQTSGGIYVAPLPFSSQEGIHNHNVSTGIQNADHGHDFNVDSAASNPAHSHTFTTDAGSSQTNWQPRYLDVIVCSKN
jgi:hypothetical protein